MCRIRLHAKIILMANDREKIEELLARNVEGAIERKHLEAALRSGKKLRVKFGIDPTSPDLHLGHAVILRKLREFQGLGHAVILVIGDFTAQIGDPSGRDKTRPPLTPAQVKANMKNYLKQAATVIDVKQAEVAYNSKWLGKLDGAKILELLGLVSVQQIIEREDFETRLRHHESIRMHELLYPILQAYDSIAIKADVELGGTDQTFNLLAGRMLMEKFNMKPQDILTMPILEGTDGVKKMSKSLGNYISLTDEPGDMFGKIMSLPDAVIVRYFKLCTDLPEAQIATMTETTQTDASQWKNIKEQLGFEVVKTYHGEKSARAAREKFEKLFSKKEIPEDVPELKLKQGKISASDILLAAGAKSKSEARRLIEQGGFDVNGKAERDPMAEVILKGGEIIRIGKKRFFKVIF